MPDTPESNVKSTVDAVKGLVEAVPVYQDLAQPAAKEVGVALQNVTKVLHIVLAPITSLVWGYDKIKDFVCDRVAEKLKDVPPERLTTPPANVVGPAIEALRYTGYQNDLRELYANLLATAIDSKTVRNAHPSFVTIIQQLSPDEARVMKWFSEKTAGRIITIRRERKTDKFGSWKLRNFSLIPYEANCTAPDMGVIYIQNLERMGLIQIREQYYLGQPTDESYKALEEHPVVKKLSIETEDGFSIVKQLGTIHLSEFGVMFCTACINPATH